MLNGDLYVCLIVNFFIDSQILTLPKISELNSTEPTIGFQVDRVKHSELGEGKVRLTAYYVSSGKVESDEFDCVFLCCFQTIVCTL